MKIVVSAGGTGGHIYPALSIIDTFKKYEKDLEVIYIGTHNRMEKDIVPKRGIKYIPIKIYGFNKKDMVRNIKNVFYIKSSIKSIRKLLREFKPDVVIGTGGYVTYPVIKAAKKENIKTFIHEQNSIPGKSNKMLSKYCDIVFTSFEESNKYFKCKCILSGNPSVSNINNNLYPSMYGLKNDKKTILITFGSLGSSTMNDKLISFLNSTLHQVIFVSGKNNYDIKNKINNSNVVIIDYIDNLSSLFKNVDLIITRAGASTLSEIISTKSISIIIPSPYVANNHQYYNALSMKNKGLAYMIEEKDVNEEILNEYTEKLLCNYDIINDIKNNLNKMNVLDSGKIIYEEIKKII